MARLLIILGNAPVIPKTDHEIDVAACGTRIGSDAIGTELYPDVDFSLSKRLVRQNLNQQNGSERKEPPHEIPLRSPKPPIMVSASGVLQAATTGLSLLGDPPSRDRDAALRH